MLKTSGFGWDDEKKMVLVDSDDVWNNYVAREPEAAHMRHKSWPYYNDWLLLFGKDRATGDLTEDAAEMVKTMILEQTNVNLDDDMNDAFNNSTPTDATDGSTTPSASTTATSKDGKKRARVNDVATKCLTDMVASFSKVFEDTNSSLAKIADSFGYANLKQDLKNTKKEDLKKNLKDQLAQLPLTLKQSVKATMLLSKDDIHVRVFLDMEYNEERMEMIEKLLQKDA